MRFKKWFEATEINWALPVMNKEMPNIQKTTQSLNLNQNDLKTALDRAKIINLPNNIWSKAKNLTQSNQPKPVVVPATTQKPSEKINLLSPPNVKTKVDLTSPVVLMVNNQPYIVSGGDSFQVARNSGTYPKALVAYL